MRKFLFLLCSLLFTALGAWADSYMVGAQVTSADGFVDGGMYVFRVNGGSYITENEGFYVAPNSQNSVTSGAVFTLEQNDGSYKVKNPTTGNYWSEPSGTGTGDSNTFVPTTTPGEWTFTFNGSNVHAGCNGYYVNRSSGVMHAYTAPINLQVYSVKMITDAQQTAHDKVSTWNSKLQDVQGLVTDASQWSTNAQETKEGSLANLIDGNTSTFFHSTWSVTGPDEDHYLQATLPEPVGKFYISFIKRNDNNRPTRIVVSDGTTESQVITEGLPAADWYITTVNMVAQTDVVRFTVTNTNTNDADASKGKNNGHPFFTFGEFYILPSNALTDAAIPYMTATDYSEWSAADIAAINSIEEQIAVLVAQKALQEELAALDATIAELQAYIDATETYTDKGNAAATATDALTALKAGAYTTAEQIAEAQAQVKVIASAFFAGIEPKDAIDITDLFIVNPTPVANHNGWEGDKSNSYDAGNNVAEYWNMSGASFHQTVALPAGSYRLTAVALQRSDMKGYVFAGDNQIGIATVASSTVNDRAGASSWFAAGNGKKIVYFDMAESGDINIGLKADDTTGDHWTVWQSFKLELVKQPAEELVNASFDMNPSFNAEATDNVGTVGTGANSNEVEGWYVSEANIWTASASFAYGTTATLNGKNVPDAPEGSESTAALGVTVGWGGSVLYCQPVTLTAGTYSLTYKAYNANEDATQFASKVGAIVGAQTFLSEKTSFAAGVWEEDEVVFNVAKDGLVVIQVGGSAVSGGSGSNGIVFFDDVVITKFGAVDALRAQLNLDIAAAQPVVDAKEGVGNGLFLKPEAAYNTFAAAVATAKDVAENEEATADELQGAIDALTAAVATYGVSTVLPEDDATYTFQQKSSGLYMALVPEMGTDEKDDVVRISSEAQGFRWVTAEGGYYLTNEAGYVGNKTDGWTTSVLEANKIVVNANPVFIDGEVYYTLTTYRGMIATDADDDQSCCYLDKTWAKLDGKGRTYDAAYWSIAKVDAEWVALIAAAEALTADADAVAVGLLIDAVEAAKAIAIPTDRSKVALQTAIDQFKANNADQEKDETAKVNTSGWKKYDGTAAGVCATQFAPAITTYDGRNAQLAEVYETTTATTGTIIYQDITGLTNGKYKVGFYGNAFFTSGRGFDSDMEDGAEDVAYVFANEKQEFITANIATSTTENNFRQFDVEVADGNIKLGMGKAKAGTNWHTMQIYQLTWFTTAKEVYAQDKEEMRGVIAAAKALAADEYKTEGKEEFADAIAAAEAALTSNRLNIAAFEAEIKNLKDAMDAFKKANLFTFDGVAYVIDAESGKFMAAGHSWGTQGIVNEMGLDLTFATNPETKKVTIDSRVSNGGNSHYLGSGLYMDAAAYEWALEYRGFCFYISNAEGQYISLNNNDELVLSDTPHEWAIVTAEGVMEQRLDEMSEADVDNPKDATFLLQNPNFNRNDQRVSAWEVSEDCTNRNLNGGNNVNNCAESYHSTFTISQTIENAPAGTYLLTAQGFYRQDDDVVEDVPVFFIGDSVATVPVKTGDENSMATASESFTNGLYTIEPICVYVGEGETLTVGIKATGAHQWVIFDNFRLTYLGEDDTTGINDVEKVSETADNDVYDLIGRRVSKALKGGIYIVNGKKVLVK